MALGSCVWFKLRAAYADIAFCVSKEPAQYLCKVLCRSSIFWGLMACWMPYRTQMPAASALIGGGPLGLCPDFKTIKLRNMSMIQRLSAYKKMPWHAPGLSSATQYGSQFFLAHGPIIMSLNGRNSAIKKHGANALS